MFVEETMSMQKMGAQARAASRVLATLSTEAKNNALAAIADELESASAAILQENALDIHDGREAGLSEALLDRLLLDEKRLGALASDVRSVIDLPDPVGVEFGSACSRTECGSSSAGYRSAW